MDVAVTDFGTPARYEPPCPCGAPIRLRGPAGAQCKAGHVARFSLGPVGYLEWPLPGAWHYERPPRPESIWEAVIDGHRHCDRCGAGVYRGSLLNGDEHACLPAEARQQALAARAGDTGIELSDETLFSPARSAA